MKVKVFLLALAYFLSGYFSLKVLMVSGSLAPIIPTAGISFLGIYFFGYRAWPGIMFGSIGLDFVLWFEASDFDYVNQPIISLGVAAGATLQALLVTWSFKRICNPSKFLHEAKSGILFVVLPSGLCALVSPVIGTLVIYLNGAEDWSNFLMYLIAGWLSESVGILMLIPFLWIYFYSLSSIKWNDNIFEFFVFCFSLFTVNQIVFGKIIGNPHYPLVYLLFPFLVWAILRFNTLITLVTSFFICCFAIWGTLNGSGPFVGRSNLEALILLQTYCWFVMATALMLIGAVEERVSSENKLKESNKLLGSIREIQNEYMTEIQPKILFKDLLEKFIDFTDSAFGFIGEILRDDKGAPYLKTYSIIDIAWDESTRKIYDENFEIGFEFRNMETLFGEVILSEKPVISNFPDLDLRSHGLPPGHPELKSFLGIPIHVDKQLVGMVGVANRFKDYEDEVIKFLDPLISTSGQLILKFRKETERFEIQNQLDFEQKRLKLITDKVPFLISFVDRDYRYQFVNETYEKWFGVKKEEVIGKTGEELLGSDVFKEIKSFVEGALEGVPQFYETFLTFKSGDQRYVAASYIPYLNSSNEVEGFFVFVQDLTDRKKAEEEIAERERQLKSILDNTPTILYMKDMQGRYLLINKKCEEVIGIKNEKIVGKTTSEVFPKEIADKLLEHDQIVMDKLMPNEVEEQIPHNGSFKTVFSVQFPLRYDDGTPYGICGISTDITERKLAEKKLQDYKDQLESIVQERTKELTKANQKLNEITAELQINEERTKFALDATTNGFWDWNLETDEVFFSDTWMESLGYKPGDLDPSLDSWKKLVHPLDMPKVMAALTPHLEGKTPFYQCENRLLSKSGDWRWNLDRGKVVKRNAKGDPIRMVGSDTDITEWKKSEEELKKSQDRILHMEKLSALGKLTGSIAHEFNNPIYGTKIILEQLRDEAHLSDQQQNGLKLAIKECYRMADLIAKLRDFYQPTSKKRERVDTHDLLFDVLLLMKNKLKEKKITVVNEFAETLPEVIVVGDQIKQVLLNVIQNAEDSFLDSSIKNEIRIKTEVSGSNLCVHVQDNGIGISKEYIKNIFDPFFTTKAAVKGTGLGLSISHGIIKDHGGSIEVKSKFGKGSTFSIKLPIKDAENEKS